MSNTLRRPRPSFKRRLKPGAVRRDGYVRDGTPTHYTASCTHNNACSYCRDNRTYGARHRAPIPEMP